MGVAGSGKTTVAKLLAKRLAWPYAEGDDFHPEANVEKMAAGTPLEDEDRWPWLRAVAEWMSAQAADGRSSIVTCSALRRAYRDVLRDANGTVRFAHLAGDRDLVGERIGFRRGHFMPSSLLDSQYETLEDLGDDEDGLVVDIADEPEQIAESIVQGLELRSRNG
ncbi:gluconokinase [Phytoactinopolyspora alkaliphila]|uniref:Gluconokinase n=1 Tax=Phytoactinopolyspora alkaliphila TaxID=1783498 RepID=A0A6N9YLV9_9ACTN|nr:gluconokinase [Phytoactinopolyspora alkaliphila]NED95964.1 gluconokinase [Phytoactinopolyspora alkaliphila]